MANDIQIFTNEEFGEIRTINIDDEPWFVGKDVAAALGYVDVTHSILDHVEEEDRVNSKTQGQNDPEFGQRGTWLINESGLYSLIMSSKLESAKCFKRWVTSEVLPTIRKTGGYVNNDELFIDTYFEGADEQTKSILRLNLAQIRQLNEEKRKLQQTVAVQTQQITEMEPKVTYYDIVLQCTDTIPISVIAKDYGKSAKWMNHYLYTKGIQYKQGDVWLLYQKYAEKGYTKTKTIVYDGYDTNNHSKIHTYWTQKGRLFIYDLMKSDGNLPLIEQHQ